jgi:osmotically-inducible protein OsmY
MSPRQNLIKLSMILSLATLLPGCALFLAGGIAETAIVLGDRRPVSVVTIDRGLQLQIDSMISQKYSQNAHVNVNVYNQKVLLTGETTTQEIKDQIQTNVSAIANLRLLVNELQVGPLSSIGSRLSDSSLFTVVKANLLATTDVPNNSMKVTTEAGKVYLMGITTELEAKAAATVASKSSNSIKEVIKLFDIISEEDKQKLIKNNASSEKSPQQ